MHNSVRLTNLIVEPRPVQLRVALLPTRPLACDDREWLLPPPRALLSRSQLACCLLLRHAFLAAFLLSLVLPSIVESVSADVPERLSKKAWLRTGTGEVGGVGSFVP
mmetsp:Transcript_12667/g.46287  ORF Transcript_12667/g.46287 Transcript_12667/m.46287 type:complete len:107 (+) Transcript_12667:3925-4245(+)